MSTSSFVEEIVSMEGQMLADEIVKGRFTQCVVAVPIKRIFTKKKEEDIYIFSGSQNSLLLELSNTSNNLT